MQARIDTIAANIANINTTGYKSKRLDFKDALYKGKEVPEDPNAPPAAPEKGAENQAVGANAVKKYVLTGSGMIAGSTASDFSDGSAQITGVATDLTIAGRGFFTLLSPSGETLYTRNGNFTVSSEGYMVNSEGCFVLDSAGGRILIDGDARDFGVSTDGTVRLPGGGEVRLGLADFSNLNGLEAVGDTCYRATAASGPAVRAENASVKQGSLENSNVELADEMTMLVRSQRAFSLASRALRTADDMEGLANNMHR
jgi:flagellar basal-body rod protein FlgG